MFDKTPFEKKCSCKPQFDLQTHMFSYLWVTKAACSAPSGERPDTPATSDGSDRTAAWILGWRAKKTNVDEILENISEEKKCNVVCDSVPFWYVLVTWTRKKRDLQEARNNCSTHNGKGSGRLCLDLWSAAAAACRLNIGSWWLARNVGGRERVGSSPNSRSLMPDAIEAGEKSMWPGCGGWWWWWWCVGAAGGDSDAGRFDPGRDCSSSGLTVVVDLVSDSSSRLIVLLFSRLASSPLGSRFPWEAAVSSPVFVPWTLMSSDDAGLFWPSWESVAVAECASATDGVRSPSDGLQGPTTMVWVLTSGLGSGMTTFNAASSGFLFERLRSWTELVPGWFSSPGPDVVLSTSLGPGIASSSTSLMSMCSFSSWSLKSSSGSCPAPPSTLLAASPAPPSSGALLPCCCENRSLFLHLARLFWNQTCTKKIYRLSGRK